MNKHPFPTARARTTLFGAAFGLIAGLVVLVIRMLVDVDRIGANAIPYIVIGAAIGAVAGYLVRHR